MSDHKGKKLKIQVFLETKPNNYYNNIYRSRKYFENFFRVLISSEKFSNRHNLISVLFEAKKINVLDAERYEVSKNKGYVGLLCLAKLVLHQKLTKNEILLG